MKKRIGPVVLLMLAFACSRPALADELTPAERNWARTCVTGLTAPSARQREGAAAALARLGPAVVALIAAEASTLITDEHWAAVHATLAGMDPKEAAKAIEATHEAWPTTTVGRRAKLLAHMRELEMRKAARLAGPVLTLGDGKTLPKSPDDVAARVWEILDSFDGESSYSGDGPRVDQLSVLGRPAIGALLADLRGRDRLGRFRSNAATDALRRLLVVDDVPIVAQMLIDGHLDVAPALTRLPAHVVVPALIAPLRMGLSSFKLVDALEGFHGDPRVAAAPRGLARGRPGGGRLVPHRIHGHAAREDRRSFGRAGAARRARALSAAESTRDRFRPRRSGREARDPRPASSVPAGCARRRRRL